MATPDISFIFNKSITPQVSRNTGEENTIATEETIVPVGQPDNTTQSQKANNGKKNVSMFQSGQTFNADDLTNNLTNVTVPPEIAGTNGVFGIFGKKTSSLSGVQRPSAEQINVLKAQVDNGTPLDAKQTAELSAQFDSLLANQPQDAQTAGKAMSYLSSHAGDCIDANGNFKFPDDFKSQPKEVQDYIMQIHGQVTGGQQTQN